MVLSFFSVYPGVTHFYLVGDRVEAGERVNDVGTQGRVNVRRLIVTIPLPVDGPVGVVAHSLVDNYCGEKWDLLLVLMFPGRIFLFTEKE